MLRHYFKVDPSQLSESEFIELSQEVLWLDNLHTERLQTIISKSISDLALVLFRAKVPGQI